MTAQQRNIYTDALNRSRKTIFDLESEASTPGTETPPISGRAKPLKKLKAPRTKDKLYLENSSNVLMDLRKAASHPMLFRVRYNDKTLDAVTKVLLKEADFKRRGAVAQYVKEDMEVMTDAELQVFLGSYLVRRMTLKMVRRIHSSLPVDPKILAGRELLPPGGQNPNTPTTVEGIPGSRPTHVDLLAGGCAFDWLYFKGLIPAMCSLPKFWISCKLFSR